MDKSNTISRKSNISDKEYKWGFNTNVETDLAPKGLNEDIVRLISSKKNEPSWMLDWRLKALIIIWTELEIEKYFRQ